MKWGTWIPIWIQLGIIWQKQCAKTTCKQDLLGRKFRFVCLLIAILLHKLAAGLLKSWLWIFYQHNFSKQLIKTKKFWPSWQERRLFLFIPGNVPQLHFFLQYDLLLNVSFYCIFSHIRYKYFHPKSIRSSHCRLQGIFSFVCPSIPLSWSRVIVSSLIFPVGRFQITHWTLSLYYFPPIFLISNYSIMSH